MTAGASLHWMSWRPTLTRLAAAMTDHAYLAIVEHGHRDLPWHAELTEIIVRHSRSPGYDPAFSLVGALQAEGLLEIAGRAATAPTRFRQPVADYVEHFHSTSSLARELMTAEEAATFDRAVTGLVRLTPWTACSTCRSWPNWPGDASPSQPQASADRVRDVGAGEPGRHRVPGPPAGAVCGHQHPGVQRGQVVEHPRDQRLEQRAAQVVAAQQGVERLAAVSRRAYLAMLTTPA